MEDAFEKIKERLEEKELEHAIDGQQYGSDGFYNLESDQRNVMQGIQEALSIVSEVEAECGNGWIPCSERLPEKYGRYLVCNDGVAWIADFFNSTWFGKRCRYSDVIAWMPLPETYKPTTD